MHEYLALYQDTLKWTKMCLLNIANCGKFSSDRTITEYAEDIWKIKPVTVDMENKPK